MPNVAAPYGLFVRRAVGGRLNSAGCSTYPVPANVTGAMFYGAPVGFVGTGGVGPVAASPTTAGQTCGLVQGAKWTAADGTPRWDESLPGNSYSAGSRNIEVMVNDDPDLVMQIQASATLSLADVGKVAGLLAFNTGNAVTGRSNASLNAATAAATGDLALRIVGVVDPGALFPDVLVTWNAGVHSQARSAGGGTVLAADAVDPEEQQKIFEDFVRDQVDNARAAQGLPPVEEKQRPGETDKQYQERIEKSRKEREARKAKQADAAPAAVKPSATPVAPGHHNKGDK